MIEKDLRGEKPISDEHVENNGAVRRMLEERGVKPEELPASEDVTKVKRRLVTDDKKVLKETRKKKN